MKLKTPSLTIILPFFLLALLTVVLGATKLFTSKPDYIYTKVKVSQGLWWASVTRPNIWYLDSLEPNEQELGLGDKPIATLLSFTYYPYIQDLRNTNAETSYNIYLKLKLQVTKRQNGELIYKRESLGVGSPIEVNLPTTKLTGTVIEISNNPIEEKFVKKTIYLTGLNAFPWEYESIKVGDTYNDGQQEIFRVLEKSSLDTKVLAYDIIGNNLPNIQESRKYVSIKAETVLKEKNGRLLLGEEQEILVGMPFNLVTQNYNYSNLVISKVE